MEKLYCAFIMTLFLAVIGLLFTQVHPFAGLFLIIIFLAIYGIIAYIEKGKQQ